MDKAVLEIEKIVEMVISDYTRVIAGIILIGGVVSLINLVIVEERHIVRWH